MQAGYATPTPLAPQDEKAELMRRYIEVAGYLRHLADRIETKN
jgi:hypothetical protein